MRKTKELNNILKEWNEFTNSHNKSRSSNKKSIDVYSTLLETYENRSILNSNNYLMNEFVVRILLDENINHDSELLNENFLKKAAGVIGMIAALNGVTTKELVAKPMSPGDAHVIAQTIEQIHNPGDFLLIKKLVDKSRDLEKQGYRFIESDDGRFDFEKDGEEYSLYVYRDDSSTERSGGNLYFRINVTVIDSSNKDIENGTEYSKNKMDRIKDHSCRAVVSVTNAVKGSVDYTPTINELEEMINNFRVNHSIKDTIPSPSNEDIENLNNNERIIFNKLVAGDTDSETETIRDSEDNQSSNMTQKAQDLIDLIKENLTISASIFGLAGIFILLAKTILSAKPEGERAFRKYIVSGKGASQRLYMKLYNGEISLDKFEDKYGANGSDASSVFAHMKDLDEDKIENWIFTHKQIDKIFRHLKNQITVNKKANRKIKGRYDKETFKKFKSLSNAKFSKLANTIDSNVLINTKVGDTSYLYEVRSGFNGKIEEVPRDYYRALGHIISDSDLIAIKEIDKLFKGFMYFITQTTFNETITEEYEELEKYISNIEGVEFNNGEVFISEDVSREDIENLSSRLAQTKILTNNRIRVDYTWSNESSRNSANELNRQLSSKISYAEKIMLFVNFVKEAKEYKDLLGIGVFKKILVKLIIKVLGDQSKEKIERKVNDIITDISGDNLTFSTALKIIVKVFFG